MNSRLEIYLSGSPYLVRTFYRKGKKTAILDRTKRWRSAARTLRAAGKNDRQISHVLGCSCRALDLVMSFTFRF